MEAVKSIHSNFDDMVRLLKKFSEDLSQTLETRGSAGQSILSFNICTLLPFWYCTLIQIDRVQKRQQDPSMNFRDAYKDIEALLLNPKLVMTCAKVP